MWCFRPNRGTRISMQEAPAAAAVCSCDERYSAQSRAGLCAAVADKGSGRRVTDAVRLALLHLHWVWEGGTYIQRARRALASYASTRDAHDGESTSIGCGRALKRPTPPLPVVVACRLNTYGPVSYGVTSNLVWWAGMLEPAADERRVSVTVRFPTIGLLTRHPSSNRTSQTSTRQQEQRSQESKRRQEKPWIWWRRWVCE